ncbi:MAG: FAD-dependent oxidoreductase [Candidatus Woesearchaeota archaeon]|nr:MAG: FAD-dependent oxidoreductase [Candidatus Woesearchaeota archaeon]
MKYDVIVVGGGPAGVSAAIYTSRFGLNTLLIGEAIGGLLNEASFIENYPGFLKTTGIELSEKLREHALKEMVEIREEKVTEIRKGFKVKTNMGKEYESTTLILALGSKKRKLDIPGEDKYIGKGVSYCTLCDGPLFRDKIVGVVGGANSAVVAAITLSDYCKKVYIIYRKDKLRADKRLVERAKKIKNIEYIFEATPEKLEGNNFLKKVHLDNKKVIDLDGLFIEIGTIPSSIIAEELGVKLDKDRYIKVNEKMETNVKGVFAAGDITTGSNKIWQVTTAVGEGTIAANSVKEYLKHG